MRLRLTEPMTTTNQQVKLLMKKLKRYNQETAAAKAGMDVKTARKYIRSKTLPSDRQKAYHREQSSIFANHWDEIVKMLEVSPRLQAHTIMNYLIRKYPDSYKVSQLRTLQRHLHDWRAQSGASQAVIFRQDIKPGKQSQSDYTCMNDLNIHINGQAFKHLLFHFILPYSRWESIYLCFGESFETLTLGYEKAVWELGCSAPEHRTDNLTAATHAYGGKREFTQRWQEFMEHYCVTPTTNNIGVSHENGSIEKSHDTLKNAIEQELMLRTSTDFATQKDYLAFIDKIVAGRNLVRQDRLLTEMDYLIELPDKKWHSPTVLRTRVSSGSIVQILDVPYTVPSRLIHYTLKAYVYPDEIILFYGNKKIQTMPRARNPLDGINYRHLIDSLIRKPAAFANYQYHEALFPRFCFRKAYDALRENQPLNADRQYLKLLQLAKLHSEQSVAEALDLLLEERQLPSPDSVKELMDACAKPALDVHVYQPGAADYDCLLSSTFGKEVH
jgi:hypothetical protein